MSHGAPALQRIAHGRPTPIAPFDASFRILAVVHGGLGGRQPGHVARERVEVYGSEGLIAILNHRCEVDAAATTDEKIRRSKTEAIALKRVVV